MQDPQITERTKDMSRSLLKTLLALAAMAAVLTLGACGGGGDEATTNDSGGSPSTNSNGDTGGGNVTEQLFAGSATENLKDPAQGKKGGTFTMLSAGDTDYMDPGKTYYSYGIGIQNAINRGLYGYMPNDTSKPVPD